MYVAAKDIQTPDGVISKGEEFKNPSKRQIQTGLVVWEGEAPEAKEEILAEDSGSVEVEVEVEVDEESEDQED